MTPQIQLPAGFTESLDGILPAEEVAELVRSLDSEAPASVRFNPYKLSSPPEGNRVPWCRYGFYTGSDRPSFTLDPLHHAGVYYVQEPSSMFVENIVRELFAEPEGVRMLDLCAAPGGKTTLLSTLAGLEGLVVSNEVISSRAKILSENVKRWGLGNTVVTANDPAHYSSVREYFDLVLVDAPCSGEGMFRKNPETRTQWSPQNVETCAARQRKILEDIWGSLKPGGILIYSTCTFNRKENEENALWLADNFDCESVEIDIDPQWGIVTANEDGNTVYRFYPHRLAGEGFCATVFRKGGTKSRPKTKSRRPTLLREVTGREAKEARRWVTQPEFMRFASIGDEIYGYYASTYDEVIKLSEALNVIHSGVDMGRMIKGSLKPSHSLALFHDVDTTAVPTVEVDLDTALDYLRKKEIPATPFTEGTNLITFNGYPIGWVKRIGNRLNNLYPKELRIANL